MSVFTPPHWSASRLMLYDQCPGAYHARYVLDQPTLVTEAMAFGSAFHHGLETHYQGLDGDLAFRRVWRETAPDIYGAKHSSAEARLSSMGLQLLEQVYALDLRGIPEHGFSLDTELAFGAPIVGAIDLWDADDVLFDFKTTMGSWSQERAELERWQPILYSWTYLERMGKLPTFEYIVCSRATGQVSRFRRTWTEETWGKQWGVAYDRLREISAAVIAGDFECHGKHGNCLECGDRWSHDHVCGESGSPRIRLGAA